MLNLIVDNFIFIVMVIGFSFLLLNHLKIEGKSNAKFKVLIILLILLIISNTLETNFVKLTVFNYQRVFFSFMCYSLRPFIVLLFISILTKNKNLKYLYPLAIINVLIYSTAFYSDIAFTFSETNNFQRGMLGYSSHIVCLIYFLVYVFIIIKKFDRKNIMNTVILSFIGLSCLSASFLDLYVYDSNLFDLTMLTSLLIYYLFLYTEYTKKDILTKLKNRQSFYYDINDYNNQITSVISIDMNGLKLVNDLYGHTEGDKALLTISNIFSKNEGKNTFFYRIGGDEFAALCFDLNEEEVQNLINRIKQSLNKTKYSCSFGYVMRDNKDDIYSLYKEADKKMYLEKEKFHKEHK